MLQRTRCSHPCPRRFGALFQHPALLSFTTCFQTPRYFFPPFAARQKSSLNASSRPRQLESCLTPKVKVTPQAASLHLAALPTWSSSHCLRMPAEASSGGKLSPLCPPRATTGGNILVSSRDKLSNPLPVPEQEANHLHHTCKWPFLMEGC